MVQGRKTSLTIRLTPTERQTLLAWQQATTGSAGVARRARMILLLADGRTITDIAATVGIGRRFVYKWVQRFLQAGLAGLANKPGRGLSACVASTARDGAAERACVTSRGATPEVCYRPSPAWHLSAKNALLCPIEMPPPDAAVLCLRCLLRP